MKTSNRISGIMEPFTSGFIFKIVYFALVLISFNTIALDVPYLKTILVGASVALGGIVLLYRLINFKRFMKMKYIWLLFAFLVSYVISLLFNLKYGFIDPIQALVWMTFQYFILFLKDPAQPREKAQKEFRIISWLFCIYMFCCSVLSILMLVFNYSAFDYERNPIKRAGFIWGRLWGVFTDPNHGAVLAIAAIFLGIYLVKCYKKSVFAKVLCGVNIFFQILYIAFSDSRTGLICLMAGGTVYAYMRISGMSALQRKKFMCQTVSCIAALCTLCVLFIIPKGVKYSYNEIVRLASTSSVEKPGPSQTPSEEKPSADRVVGREQDLESDISNRRFDLWKSGLEVYRMKPIFGVSIFNMIPFAQQHLPNTYIINNEAGLFDNVHNAFLNVLIGQGLVGFVILMIFAALSVILVLKGFFKENGVVPARESSKNALLISSLVALAVSMLVQGDIIYLNSGPAFLFWYILGFLIVHFSGKESEACA